MARKEMSNVERLNEMKYAALAGQSVGKGDYGIAVETSNFLYKDMLAAGELVNAEPLINALTNPREVTPEQLKSVIGAYGKQYKEAQDAATISERLSYFGDSVLKYFSDKGKGILKKIADRFGNEVSGDISAKLKKANYILSGAKDNLYNFSKSAVKAADEIVKKLSPLEKALKGLESMKMDVIQAPIIEKARGGQAEGIASDLEKYLQAA